MVFSSVHFITDFVELTSVTPNLISNCRQWRTLALINHLPGGLNRQEELVYIMNDPMSILFFLPAVVSFCHLLFLSNQLVISRSHQSWALKTLVWDHSWFSPLVSVTTNTTVVHIYTRSCHDCVCMCSFACICVSLCICLCVCVCLCVNMHLFLYARVFVCILNVCFCVCESVVVYMFVCYLCMYEYMCVLEFVCESVYMCVHVQIPAQGLLETHQVPSIAPTRPNQL